MSSNCNYHQAMTWGRFTRNVVKIKSVWSWKILHLFGNPYSLVKLIHVTGGKKQVKDGVIYIGVIKPSFFTTSQAKPSLHMVKIFQAKPKLHLKKPSQGSWFLKKNVWTSDKSWEPGSFLMFSYVFQCFLTFSNVTYSHSHSHSLSQSHSLTISLSHSFSL